MPTPTTATTPAPIPTEIGELRALARALEALSAAADRAADAAGRYGLPEAYRVERVAEAAESLRMARTLIASAHRRTLKRQLKK